MINGSDTYVISSTLVWSIEEGGGCPSLYPESSSFPIGLTHYRQTGPPFVLCPLWLEVNLFKLVTSPVDNLSFCRAPLWIWQQEIYCLNRVPMNKNINAGACQMNPLNQDNFCLGMLSGADCSIHFCKWTRLPVLVLGFVDLHPTDQT